MKSGQCQTTLLLPPETFDAIDNVRAATRRKHLRTPDRSIFLRGVLTAVFQESPLIDFSDCLEQRDVECRVSEALAAPKPAKKRRAA